MNNILKIFKQYLLLDRDKRYIDTKLITMEIDEIDNSELIIEAYRILCEYKHDDGYLYCMYNEVYEIYGKNVYKLGCTNDLVKRLESYVTPYIEHSILTYTSKKLKLYEIAEKVLFDKLKNYRIIEDREFFDVPIDIVKKEIDNLNRIFTNDDIYKYIIRNNYIFKCDLNIINEFIKIIKSLDMKQIIECKKKLIIQEEKNTDDKKLLILDTNVEMEKIKKEYKEMLKTNEQSEFKLNAEIVSLWLCIRYNKLCETLKKSYIKDMDYIVMKRDTNCKLHGGQNKLLYFLTIDCFKKVMINTRSKNKSKILQIIGFDHLL